MPATALGIFALTAALSISQIPPPETAPGQLVREVVYNEFHVHARHGYWRYLAERHLPQQVIVEDEIETADGTVKEVVLSDGRPLGAAARHNEQERLGRLLASESDKARLRQEHFEDEKRIGRILARLPLAAEPVALATSRK